MALASNNLFSGNKEPMINYSWEDTLSATGYVVYSCWATQLATGNTYLLTTKPVAKEMISIMSFVGKNCSVLINTVGIGTNASYTKLIDLDFDTSTFQQPRTMRGTAIIRLGKYVATSVSSSTYILIRIRKWDGSSETEIANSSTIAFSVSANTETPETVTIELAGTLIKKGEKIRLTLEAWGKYNAGAGSCQINVGLNPQDTAEAPYFTTGNSSITVAIPFKMDY